MYALVYAHTVKNIAHRDIKPENVLLDENFNIKITDFGLSSEISDGDFLKTFCGSPNYAAPEVISGKPYVGTEIDVWSCGVMLYLMLTGHLPFMDDHNPSLYRKIAEGVFYMPPRLDPNAKYLITHMLQVDPFKRLSVQQVLENEWTKENLPPYIMRVSLPKPPVLGMLSSLVRKKQPVVKGIGRIDESILTELAGLLGVTTAEVAGALDKEGENAIKVAYRICKDFRKIGRDCES
jgi:carbon catabolite-derepressing protein kinase